MKHIPLTQGKFAIVDDEDYDWLMTWKWFASKNRGTYYAHTWVGKTFVKMHRMIMLYPKKPLQVDHINHNGLDNRRSNLRVVTSRANQYNRRKSGTSKYPGVYWHTRDRRWKSAVKHGSKLVRFGSFKSEEEAFNARVEYMNRNRLQ